MPDTPLTAYLANRARLANQHSDFHCDPACRRPGCKNPDLQIEVSLLDLWGASQFRQEPLPELLGRCYSLGLFGTDKDERLRRIALRLHKPCPFLHQDLCVIYPVRPLPCMLFPEYLVVEGRLASEAAKEHFREYLCLGGPLVISLARAEALRALQRLWRRETLLTSFYLFGHSACYLDLKNLLAEFPARSPNNHLPQKASGKQHQISAFISHQTLELAFKEYLASTPPLSAVPDKIRIIGTPAGQEELWRYFHDERLLTRLQHGENDRVLMIALKKGRVKAQRRSLKPPAGLFW